MRVDSAEHRRHLTPLWLRPVLFILLLALGNGYIVAFVIFTERSEDFIVAQQRLRAVEFSAAHVVQSPTTIEFNSRSGNAGLLSGGWHNVESDGVWTAMKDAEIELCVNHHDAPVHLRFRLDALIAKRQQLQIIRISVNGKRTMEVKRIDANADEPIDMTILPADFREGGRLSIRLHSDQLVSPFVIRAGRDNRALGLRLRSIEISDSSKYSSQSHLLREIPHLTCSLE